MNKNFWQRSLGNKTQAQIATLLTLIMAAIFLFVAITINIGKVSQKKTQVSKAADAASLQFSSQIGSFAHYLSCNFLKCKRKICKFSWSMFFKALMWSGLIGAGLWFLGAGWWALTAIAPFIAGSFGFLEPLMLGPMAYIEASAWEGLNRQFKKMSAQMKFKEGVILNAWLASVDDPNLIKDVHDIDEDNRTDDLVSEFLVFYNNRLDWINNEYTNPLRNAIGDFKPEVISFEQQAWNFHSYLNGTFVPLLQELEGCGYEVSFWAPEATVRPCEEVCSASECAAFEEGCESDCAPCDCYEEYLESISYSQTEIIKFELDDFHGFVNGEEGTPGFENQTLDELVASYPNWYKEIYDDGCDPCKNPTEEERAVEPCPDPNKEEKDDFYDVFAKWRSWIGEDDYSGWRDELRIIKEQVEQCIANPISWECDEEGQNCVCVACCCALDGRIQPAMDKLRDFITDISNMQAAILEFNAQAVNLDNKYKSKGTYSWQDKFGKISAWHHVKAEVSSFRMPRIKTYRRRRFKKCAKLLNHSGSVWVKVSRYDQEQTGYPFWKFRYSSEKADFSPEDPDNIPGEYWLKAKSTTNYSYTAEPPTISATE